MRESEAGDGLGEESKDRSLDVPHEHDVEHAVVRDQNIRGRFLHVPAAPHLAAVETRKETRGGGLANSSRHVGQAIKFLSKIAFCPGSIVTARDRRPAVVAAKPEPISRPVGGKPGAYAIAVERSSQPCDLVFDQRIKRIEDEGADRWHPPPCSWARWEMRGW